ncbi:MAG: pseudouridine synthase [candidate division Zixibacteria bacterium]|nr:pseudouridine synthase [candidate division Zixibacteria bacterium]
MERGRGIRINRYLAMCGVGARRAVERLVVEGRVEVDGEVVDDLAFRVASSATVRVDGKLIEVPRRFRYVAYYKRPGVLTTAEDPFHRKTVRDELPRELRGLRAVGRLDADTEGLLLLTDDGSFAHRVAHPSFGVVKRYVVALKGRINKYEVAALERGIELLDGRVGKVKVDSVGRCGTGSSVTLSVGYGRKRMIRQMFAALGKEIVALRRVAVGPVTLGGLRPGRWRDLTREEVTALGGP